MAMKGGKLASGAHFVGSIPGNFKNNTREVFETLAQSLGDSLKEIPDGELGERYYYVNWQYSVFSKKVQRRGISIDQQSHNDEPLDASYEPILEDVGPLRYDTYALASYKEFCQARASGAVGEGVRFQVSLPLPLDAVGAHVEPAFQARVVPLYERRMLEVVENLQRTIPARDLAIQWDLALCVGMIESERGNLDHPFFRPWAGDAKRQTLQAAERMLDAVAVSRGVSVGLHICYGDLEHRHFVEPHDLGLPVDLANELARYVGGVSADKSNGDSNSNGDNSNNSNTAALGWVHMPVPRDRDDDAYYEPLTRLRLDPRTRLYLGLVHADDGVKGATRRILAAKKAYAPPFGVATECGLGRTAADRLPKILDIMREVNQLPN